MIVVLAMVVLLLAMAAGPAMAAPGGLPGAHGVEPGDWGMITSGAATSEPGAVAAHILMQLGL
jgi:hypothetical protein